MAIKIPILTSFDPKGLKQANAAFGELQTSLGSLGKNFAIVGAGIIGATALLGNAVMSASNFEAEFEGVNQVFKEAASSVQAFAETAAETAGLSETEALRAAKTFGLFATGAGLGVNAAADFSTTMVQLAGDLGSFNDLPTDEALAAIQSGLMGQAEPLRKFGVFLDDAALKSALLNATGIEVTGTLSTQQKMMAAYYAILEQTTVQQGDFVAYQDTLGNSLKTTQANFADLTREIGTILIPAITAAMPHVQAMSAEIGEKLKTAVESIDWESLINSIVSFASFLIANAETIGKVVIALFALNTMFKAVTVATALASTAKVIYTWVTAQLTAGVTLATIALKAFRTALITTGIGAVLVGLGFLADWMFSTSEATDEASGSMDEFTDSTEQARIEFEKLMADMKNPPIAPPPSGPSGPSNAMNDAVRAAEEAARRAAEEARRAAEEARRAEEERLEKRRAAYQSFADSVKSIFGQIKESILSSFNLPRLGNSVNSITRNIAKLLEKTRGFAKNITQLSGLGLDTGLLQQVIQAGPMAGSQLASAIVGGGSAFVSQLNAAYGEIGNLASGIAGVGTERAFANQEVINNYYEIEVSGGVGSGPSIGKAIVDAIKSYERTSGAVWQGAN
jgi:vacuolar-type H+-ATPase subunit E/Vma4